MQNLKAIINHQAYDIVAVDKTKEIFVLSTGEEVNFADVKVLRGSGFYECPRRYGEVTDEIFENDVISWKDNRFNTLRGKVKYFDEKGYWGVEVGDNVFGLDTVLLCSIERPAIVGRGFVKAD